MKAEAAPLGLDALEPAPVKETYWAYRYPDGSFWSCHALHWPLSTRKRGQWRIASSDVNDVVKAMRQCDDEGAEWRNTVPKYSGQFVEVTLEELGHGVAIIGGWPVVSRWID